jgi:hypothetical protein
MQESIIMTKKKTNYDCKILRNFLFEVLVKDIHIAKLSDYDDDLLLEDIGIYKVQVNRYRHTLATLAWEDEPLEVICTSQISKNG